jgi:hypothetical protein
MKFRIVFWDVLPCKIIVDRRFRGTCCLHHQEWVVENYFIRQYIPEDNFELNYSCFIFDKSLVRSLMMEATRTSETSVDNYFTQQYIPEDNSELYITCFTFEWLLYLQKINSKLWFYICEQHNYLDHRRVLHVKCGTNFSHSLWFHFILNFQT